MEQAYTQIPNPVEAIDFADNRMESKLNLRDHFSPDPQLLSEVAQVYHSRPRPRSYISSPLSSTAFSSPTSKSDSSPSDLSSKAYEDDPLTSPHSDHQQRASSGSRLLFQSPDENGALHSGEKSNILFGSTSTRRSSTSWSGVSSPLLPCDHSRYPSDKSRKLEGFGFVVYDYDLYETKEPDDDDWLHVPDSNAQLPSNRVALPWRGIANVGFLAVLLVIILFLFVGLPIYTTIVQGWDTYGAGIEVVETICHFLRRTLAKCKEMQEVLSHEKFPFELNPLAMLDFVGL